jgi:aspartate/methionine/tyrosine aminotransferase
MMTPLRTKRSDYMEWAKLSSTARFNLATSGIMSVPGSEFPPPATELEITAPGGYGYAPLQERLARHAGVRPESIVTAAGASMANHLALAALLEPGDKVVIEQPAYGPLLDVAHYLGARVKRLVRRADRAFAIDLAEFDAAATQQTRLVVLTNLHNPSGALISAETLRRIGKIALERGVHILVDEVYLEMMFDEPAPTSFAIGASLGGENANPFIVTNSLTKAYGLSGLRCGWIVAHPELAHRMWRLNDLFGANAAHPAEQLSVIAFDHLQQFRDRTRALLATNRPILDAFLDSRSELDCLRAPAGTVAFPKLRSGNGDRFAHLLREKYETSIVPGRFFELPDHFRIGIGGDTAQLREGLVRIAAALDEFAG